MENLRPYRAQLARALLTRDRARDPVADDRGRPRWTNVPRTCPVPAV